MSRAIDHVVHAVHDLDAAARRFEGMGFAVGPRNRHPWGTENRIAGFANRTFLELITVPDPAMIAAPSPGTFGFGMRVLRALEAGEGVPLVALRSGDAHADAREFADKGVGAAAPFFFERRGAKPDGTPVRVAFTLAAAGGLDEGPVVLFACQHHEPEAFWSAAAAEHPNGAVGLTQVLVATHRPARVSAYLAQVLDAPARPLGGDEHGVGPEAARFTVLTAEDAAALLGEAPELHADPCFAAYRIEVPDLGPVQERLARAGLPAARRGHSLVVPASAAFGAAVAFHAP